MLLSGGRAALSVTAFRYRRELRAVLAASPSWPSPEAEPASWRCPVEVQWESPCGAPGMRCRRISLAAPFIKLSLGAASPAPLSGEWTSITTHFPVALLIRAAALMEVNRMARIRTTSAYPPAGGAGQFTPVWRCTGAPPDPDRTRPWWSRFCSGAITSSRSLTWHGECAV